MENALQNKLSSLPASPGVYLFYDKRGKVVYVGKAKSLRNRVRSYFSGLSDGRAQFESLVNSINNLEVIVTENEVEALILEANLIKNYHPRFNISFRDDKFFPFLKVTKELFPRIFLTRKTPADGSAYYGPFTEVRQVRRLVKVLKESFQIRSCNYILTPEGIKQDKYDLCLDYHINLCGGACKGYINSETYNQNVRQLVRMVKGDVAGVIKELKRAMTRAAEALKFEKASLLRDRLKVVEEFSVRQVIISPDKVDRDVLGLATEDDDGCIVVLRVREGKLLGREHFFIRMVGEKSPEKVLSAFIQQFYLTSDFIPRQLLSPLIPAEEDLLRLWLEQEREGRVEFLYPKKGNKLKLINLARANAEMLLGEKRRETETRDRFAHSIQALKENLKLPQMPVIIEAFDISNTAGSEPVASLVVFKNGRPLKSEYRIFNIKSVAGIDDCAMMMEAVSRRYARVLKEAGTLPNLILIDGGKGQLSSAIKSLKKLNLSTLPVIGLAKRLDEIYLPAPSEPLNLPRTSSALKLLQQIRDEAHRFAISHHRKRRAKSGLKSILDQIPGVGKVRKERLMKHFKTLEKIKVAKIEELVSISGIDRKTAKSIYDYFSTLNLKDKKAEV